MTNHNPPPPPTVAMVPFAPCLSEFQRLKNDISRLHKEQALAEGREIGQKDQVSHLQRELESELYAGVEDRYMDMLIKLKVGGYQTRGGIRLKVRGVSDSRGYRTQGRGGSNSR